jgi:serum/glucocorticoid-regulated kinase 2
MKKAMGSKKAQAEQKAASASPKAPKFDSLDVPDKGPKVTMDDFDIVKVLGRGAFGKVMLVKKKDDATKKLFALKTWKKADIVKAGQVEHTMTERFVLQNIESPFLAHMSYAWQTPEKLYVVMDYLTGGELFFWIKKHRKFTESRAKLYLAECCLAIKAMHDKNVIHRDLKPENILLDADGHLKIVDYGLAKGNITGAGEEGGTKTFCGTPEYVAPELVENRGHGKAVDWWALGVILYELLYGLPTFYDKNVKKMYTKILHDPIKFSSNVAVSDEAKDFIRKLLERNYMNRLGSSATGPEDVLGHPFFASLDLKKVAEKKVKPEFVPPKQKNDADVRNFDDEFTSEAPTDSMPAQAMTDTMQEKAAFTDFTYNENAKR